MEFQNALHSLVQALREEGRVAVHCLALSQSLQAASSKKIRLPALLCLHPIAVALKGSLDNLSRTSSKVAGTARIFPVDLPCLIAALSALGAAVRNAALGAARLLLSDMAVEKAVTDVYVLVLMALERVQTETTSRGEQADDENIILLCVAAYDALYTLIGEHNIQQSCYSPRILSGPFLAQLIQALLYFSGHPSKAVTASALHCLDNLLILGWTCSGDLHKPTTWQPFYPGIFSGLYALTLHSGGVTRSVLIMKLDLNICLTDDIGYAAAGNAYIFRSAPCSARRCSCWQLPMRPSKCTPRRVAFTMIPC